MFKSILFRTAAMLSMGAMLLSSPAFADAVLDDFEGGTNQNRFEDYWYFYNDAENNGTSQVSSADVSGSELIFRGGYTPGYSGSSYAGLLDYTFGSAAGMDEYVDPFVGIGTNLTADGATRNLTGATKITFYAKASAPMAVRFKLEQSNVLDFNHYQTTINVTTQWTLFSVDLNTGLMGLAQESWGDEVTFDLTKATKVAWEIKSEGTNPASGQLWLDDVVIVGYSFVSKYECPTCMGVPGAAPAGAVLSDFEGLASTRNALKYYWYCYNDVGTRAVSDASEYSSLFGGVKENVVDPTKPTLDIAGNGQGAGNGAFIEFELGPTFEQNGETIKPFVGIGTMTSDALGTVFYNASSAGATGVYFEYKTSASVEYLTLEISDGQDRGNEGLVHFIRLPGTAGVWKSASIPFSEFKLPDWDEVKLMLPALKALKTSQIAKMQWKYQGNTGDEGSVAIDNVVMVGQSGWDSGVIGTFANRGAAGGLNLAKLSNTLHISLVSGKVLENAHVSLSNALGRVVSKQSFDKTVSLIDVGNLSAGRYFLRVNGMANGTAVSYGATVVLSK